MDQTFITIHNLSADANILFASESIIDILGHSPQQVKGRSCFDFFHPEDVLSARSIHNRGVLLDKAAVLQYTRLRAQDGSWVKCECCFTIAFDVLVASTRVYKWNEESQRRAIDAPHIGRLFSSSPRDSAYPMIQHLSPRFSMPALDREPRTVLILNRFTRSLSIMFSTKTVLSILGLSPDELTGRSFYDCIREDCLDKAADCLENAKANNSVAYLRFWLRDPREGVHIEPEAVEADVDFEGSIKDEDTRMNDAMCRKDDMDIDEGEDAETLPCLGVKRETKNGGTEDGTQSQEPSHFKKDRRSLLSPSRNSGAATPIPSLEGSIFTSYEMEAIISCTSDGLLVVIRRAYHQLSATKLERNNLVCRSGVSSPRSLSSIRDRYPRRRVRPYQLTGSSRGQPESQLLDALKDATIVAWTLVGMVSREDRRHFRPLSCGGIQRRSRGCCEIQDLNGASSRGGWGGYGRVYASRSRVGFDNKLTNMD